MLHKKSGHFHVTRWDVPNIIIDQSQQCKLFMNEGSDLYATSL